MDVSFWERNFGNFGQDCVGRILYVPTRYSERIMYLYAAGILHLKTRLTNRAPNPIFEFSFADEFLQISTKSKNDRREASGTQSWGPN